MMKLGSLSTQGAQDAATELHSTAALAVEIRDLALQKKPTTF
jgi:hypothetical protein